MGRRNLPCSTVNAQTENSTGALFASNSNASRRVSESLPPERATATRSPSRIILKRPTASPTFRNSIFSRSKPNGNAGDRRFYSRKLENVVGTTVLQYQLIEKLGSGGMGDVYKAQDTRLNRFVAIKVLPAKMSTDPERRRRFVQEAQAASALNHPNIITIYDIVTEGDAQFMVMEFVSGTTLHDAITSAGMPVPQVLQYGAQMADALAAAHAAGIIHRDLKPSNVMITRSGLVKVLDFGLAKLTDLGPTGDKQAAELGPLTQEGAILGTVSYMSPEQAEGKSVDARSDIFSFGSVLYEMVSGRRAFDGGSSISTLSSVLRDDVKPFADVAPDTPPLLEAIISRCLPKDPNARWQSMKEVEKALSSLKRTLDSNAFDDATVRAALPAPAGTAAPQS